MDERRPARPRKGRSRPSIPRRVQDELLLESGYKCAVPQCRSAHGLVFHHIDGDPSDTGPANLIVLCATHHRMATGPSPKLDRGACEMLKQTLRELNVPLILDRQELRRTWRKLQRDASHPTERGDLLEFLAENLMTSVPGLIVVEKRGRGPGGDVDLLIRNSTPDGLLKELGPQLVVACKARKGKRVQDTEVAELVGRMVLHRWTAGLLFSLSGFSRKAVAVAERATRNEFRIALIGPEEIAKMIESEDQTETIKRIVNGSLLAG